MQIAWVRVACRIKVHIARPGEEAWAVDISHARPGDSMANGCLLWYGSGRLPPPTRHEQKI